MSHTDAFYRMQDALHSCVSLHSRLRASAYIRVHYNAFYYIRLVRY